MPGDNLVEANWTAVLKEAIAEVFSMMLGCEIEAEDGGVRAETPPDSGQENGKGQPSIEVVFHRDSRGECGNTNEVTAVVGIAGELCGVFNFACGTPAARMMAAKMLGIEEELAGEQQWDALGEICNMIAGNFKSKLPGIGEHCMLSVPTIVVGSNYQVRSLARRHRMEYRFRVDGAPAHLTLELQQ